MKNTISKKFGELLNSLRFWQVTGALVMVLLAHYSPENQFLWNAIAGYLATVAGIGTVDSVAKKIAGN